MTDLALGDVAPDFTLPGDASSPVALSDYKGKYVIVYFYPKDDTPGCTKEAIGFTEKKSEFGALGAEIIGISKDTAAKHDKFIAKHNLGIRLGSDEKAGVTEAYGVWVEKNMYGRKYMGIERATFLIGPDGKILEIWRKVRVKDHVQKVFESVESHVAA